MPTQVVTVAISGNGQATKMIDTTFRQSKIIRETVNLHGDKQYMVAVEEMAELMQAISKYLRIDNSGYDDMSQIKREQMERIDNITAEMADVYIMLEELQFMLNIINADIRVVIDRKLNRQFERNRQKERRNYGEHK